MRKGARKFVDLFKNTNVYVLYSICFIIMFIFLFREYFIQGKSFIWSQDLGGSLKPTIWLSRYLKDFFNNLFINHKLQFQMWEFYQYEGTDVFQGFNNVIGNPLLWLSAVVPNSLIPLFYNCIMILMFFLSGIGFVLLCKECNIKNEYGMISGALTYIFCQHSLFCVTNRIMYLLPIMYAPYIFVGIEKVFKKESPLVYILSLFLIANSFFYYYYMIVIFIIIYVIIRVALMHKNINDTFFLLFKVFLYSLIALLMSAFVLLPTLSHMLIDTRLKGIFTNYAFYPLTYFIGILKNLFSYQSTGHNFRLGYPTLTITAIVFMIINYKKNIVLCVSLVLLTILTIFPFFGRMLNGFQYPTNRWCFIIALFIAFCISRMWDIVIEYEFKSISIALVVSLIYTILLISCINIGTHPNISYQLILLFLNIIVLLMPLKKYIKSVFLFVLLIIGIIINASYYLLSNHANRINANASNDRIKSVVEFTETSYLGKMVKSHRDLSIFRYAPNYSIDQCNDYLNRISSTAIFCSLTNPYAQDFTKHLALNRSASHRWSYYDNAAILNLLSNVKYITSSSNEIPKGMTKIADVYNNQIVFHKSNKKEDIDKAFPVFKIFKNEYFLPMIYAYDGIVDEKLVNEMIPCDIQLNMLKNAVVNNYQGNTKVQKIRPKSAIFDSTIKTLTKDIYLGEQYLVCYKKNQAIELNFSDIKGDLDRELYIYITGLDYKSITDYDLYYNKNYVINDKILNIDSQNQYNALNLNDNDTKNLLKKKNDSGLGISETNIIFANEITSNKMIIYRNGLHPNTTGYHNYNVNLGNINKPINSVKLTFSQPGIYIFDGINVVSMPLDDYDEAYTKLNNNAASNIEISTNMISCETNYNSNKFLCVAESYYPGWKAYIDGRETKIYPTNYMHIGFDVPAGKHKIELKYTNIYFTYGCIISLIGFISFVVTLITFNKLKIKELNSNNI